MNRCSRCGVENLEGAKFCGSCGGRIEAAFAPPPAEEPAPPFPAMRGMAPVEPPRPPESYALMRGMAVASTAPTPLEQPHYAMRGMPSVSAAPDGARFASGKIPWIAILLSFAFPGGGQFYNSDIKKGFVLLGLALVAYLLTLQVGAWYLGMPLSLGVWVWGMLDAGKVARRQKAIW